MTQQLFCGTADLLFRLKGAAQLMQATRLTLMASPQTSPRHDRKVRQKGPFGLSGVSPDKAKEIAGWAFYDVANSTYATIIATTVYNAYFVRSTGDIVGTAQATVLLGCVTTISSLAIVASAPFIGAIADVTGAKKRALFIATIVCVAATACLALIRPEQYHIAMVVLLVSSVAYGTGENLIAAFLPEIADPQNMGKVSAIGWASGYLSAVLSLAICALYIGWAKTQHQSMTEYAPALTMVCACLYGLFSIVTFSWLKERRSKAQRGRQLKWTLFALACRRLTETIRKVQHYRDLFRFLVALFVFSCGTTSVIQLAAVYAEQALHFTIENTLALILIVNVSCAFGAFVFGFLQDKIGSSKTIVISLVIWTGAIFCAFLAQEKLHLWLAGNLVGLALGGTGSASRALVAKLSPPDRTGEFLGLWGMAVKLATAVGPLTFAVATMVTHGNYRQALLITLAYFILGAFLMKGIDEARGLQAARTQNS